MEKIKNIKVEIGNNNILYIGKLKKIKNEKRYIKRNLEIVLIIV